VSRHDRFSPSLALPKSSQEKKTSRDTQQYLNTTKKNSNFLKKYSKKYTKEITASSKIIRQFGFNCKRTTAMIEIQMHAHERERERERESTALDPLFNSGSADILFALQKQKLAKPLITNTSTN
jgi:hypothetical protein